MKCPRCGGPLPEPCSHCPPKVINCPYCGAEVLLERSADEELEKFLEEYKKRVVAQK